MRGLSGSMPYIITGIVVIVEILAYYGMVNAFDSLKNKTRRGKFTLIYVLFSVLFLSLWAYTMARPSAIRDTHNYDLFYFIIGYTVFNFFPKTIISLGFMLHQLLLFFKQRLASKICLAMSLILSLSMSLSIIYGIFIGKRAISTEKVELCFKNLPSSLDGTTLAVISDLHLGSFNNSTTLNKCADIINNLDADLLLFTGDMVNNFEQEMHGFVPALQRMTAKHGKYAIYGNHDYGDYSNWNMPSDKQFNFSELSEHIAQSGFTLLNNEHVKIPLADTCVYLIGVQNWGLPPFPQYADLDQARAGIPPHAFQILLTHDPSHWEQEVVPHTDISLSLSGHTHGGQFGVKFAGITFSPIYIRERLWGGLYQSDEQKLYVNRGFGAVGFPGRIDMNPEITLITLKSQIKL